MLVGRPGVLDQIGCTIKSVTELSNRPSRFRLFGEYDRIDQAPKRHKESSYSFLDRIKNPYCERLRSLLEMWFEEYPPREAPDLANRFKSDLRRQHFPAWWELYIFSLFKKLGFNIDVHPTIAGSTNQPDFSMQRNGLEFYIEAATFFSEIEDDHQMDLNNAIYDAINTLSNPNFFVGLDIDKRGTQYPRIKDITRPLEKWLDSLDPDVAEYDENEDPLPPEHIISTKDWRLRFSAYPLPLKHRDKGGRLLAAYPVSAGWLDDREAAYQKMKAKRSKYGDLDKPYVIALLPWAPFFNTEDAVDALFGEIRYSYIENGPVGQEAKRYRLNNGIGQKGGEQGRGVSAILLGLGFDLWNPIEALPQLWLNPWAKNPIEADNFPFPVTRLEGDGTLSHSKSRTSASSVFGLPPDWLDKSSL